MEATALRKQGWSISAIARHLHRDRKTIRRYLAGATIGERRRAGPDAFAPFVPYVAERLCEDPHLWASALFDEVNALGFSRSYQTFTRELRARGLRPHCEACDGVKGRATIEIEHPPGAEIQWDWVELPEAPWGEDAHVLVGSLPCSGRFRAVFCESEDQPHLIDGIDEVLRRLGGTAREWRFDRMATVVNPSTGKIQSSFVPVAKHYGVRVVACPPRRGNRKGSVEKSIHFATQRFWRTMDATTMAQAQDGLDAFCERTGDARPRPVARLEALVGEARAASLLTEHAKHRPTVRDLAELERLRPLPAAPFPATLTSTAIVDPSCLVRFEGNAYSVPPGLQGHEVTVAHRLGTDGIEVTSSAGRLVASHRRHRSGAGYVVRDEQHRAELEAVVLAAFSTDPPCRTKANRPPGPRARDEAARLVAAHEDPAVIVSLALYQAIAEDIAERGQR